MILEIFIVLAVIVVMLAIIVATRPAGFRISRSLAISAPPAFLFQQVDNLQLWEAWSPWIKMDPQVKKTYDGPANGVGAGYSWVGEKSGEGRMVTIESRPNELIRFDLKFFKPFPADNTVEFTFKPEGNQTVVTWTMTGTNSFFAKGFDLIMNFDKVIGGQFENGLQNLKSIAETSAQAETA